MQTCFTYGSTITATQHVRTYHHHHCPSRCRTHQAIDEIIWLPNDGASTGEKVPQAVGKIEELQQTLYQVPIQGSSKRPNGKKNKKKSKLPDETLRVNPPQPTLPVKFLVSDPGIKVESLPTYEEMTIDELFNGPSRTWKGRKTIIRIARGKLQR